MKSKVCLIFILLLSLLTNLVYANSVEIASVTAHYVHPVNNTVEDSGNNEEIGQGMTEAVLGPQALVEVDEKNNIYATFRFNMTDQISDIKIAVQKIGEKAFKSVSYTKMQSTSKTMDLRVPLTSKDSIIRIEAFVDAMGRAVIFYGKLGQRVEGNTDFVVSVSTDDTSVKQDTQASADSSNDVQTKNNINEVIQDEAEQNDNEDIEIASDDTNDIKSEKKDKSFSLKGNDYSETGLILKGDARLESFNTDNESSSQEAEVEIGYFTKTAIYSIFNVFATISVLSFILGILSAVLFYRLRKINDIKEGELYGFKAKK